MLKSPMMKNPFVNQFGEKRFEMSSKNINIGIRMSIYATEEEFFLSFPSISTHIVSN